MRIHAVLETSLYVDDLPSAERFYRDVLGLELLAHQPGRHLFFRCGTGVVLLFDPRATATIVTEVGGVPIPLHGASGPGHLALSVPEAELADWRERLEGWDVAIEAEVVWPAGGRSLYFRDPAGNSVELVTRGLWGLPTGW